MIEPKPPLNGIVESSLYVANLDESEQFYRTLLGCEQLTTGDRLRALSVNDQQVLLLFLRGGSVEPIPTNGGTIPPHDSRGTIHLAFAIPSSSYEAWKAQVENAGVAIESEVTWDRGGRSIYFRDPDGHLIELATPGIWTIY